MSIISQLSDNNSQTPQRTESAKKPKTTIKLTTKPANGTATPQSAKDSTTKSAKTKTKKATPKVKEPEFVAPKSPELSPEEKRVKKEVRSDMFSCITRN